MPESVRLLPVLDRLRYAPSPGAQRLAYLRALSLELDALSITEAQHLEWQAVTRAPHVDMTGVRRLLNTFGRDLPVSYDQLCFETAMRLREQGSYLIAMGF